MLFRSQVMPAASAVQATGQTMQVQTAPVVPQQPQPVQMPAQAQTRVVPQAQQAQPQVVPIQQMPVTPVQPVTGPNDLTIPRNDQLNNQKGVA